jgi:hypothetical protein
MAEYLLLIVGDEAAYGQLSEEEGKAIYAGHEAFMGELRDAGVTILSSVELEPSRTARTIMADGTVTDGPFAEAKEHLGGFYVIDVATMDDAVGWAKRIPTLPGDIVEVRPAVV